MLCGKKTEIGAFERLDDLGIMGYKLLQDSRGFCFGIDAVLLAAFCRVKRGDKAVDLGCNSGIISVLLCAKTDVSEITGVEIIPEMAALAQRNAEMNGLQDKIKIINADLCDLGGVLPGNAFDAVISNPPYKKSGSGLKNENEWQKIARHEITCSLEDVFKSAKRLLKPGKSLFMVHRPDRLCDIIACGRDSSLEIKRLRFVYPSPESSPVLVLIEAKKGARPLLKAEKPLFIRDEKGDYTKEILKIYEGGML